MNTDTLGDVIAGDAKLQPRPMRLGRLCGGRRAEDNNPGDGQLPTELERLSEGRHAKRRRTGLESDPADIEGTVTVGVSLDDRPQVGPID